jgi:type I restriction enzyme S subunit
VIHDLTPYPLYKDSGVPWLGLVPEHWKILRARYLFREIDLRSQTGTEPHLSMSQKLGLVPSSLIEQQTLVSESYTGGKLCNIGDLVLNRLKAHLGVFALAKQDGVVSSDYTVLRRNRNVEVPYYEHILRSPACRHELRVRAKGIVEGFWRLYTDDFYDIQLPVPSDLEQSAIVHFLAHINRRIQHYIRAKKKLIALLSEQRQAVIHHAATRGLDPNVRFKPSGVEWLGEVPEHWEIWQVGHFGRVGNGSTPSRGNVGYWNGGTYPWLNSSSVNRGRITKADQFVTNNALQKCHLPRVQPGSVLVAITGQGRTRGTAAILDFEATINQHIVFITPYSAVVGPEYLLLSLVGAYRELRAISQDSGSTKGALTCRDIAHFKIALPPLNEQAWIVSEVRRRTQSLEEALTRTERQIDLIQEYRTRLIADVVTGKLDVREAAARLPDEAEESLDGDETSEAGEAGGIAELDAAEESEA